MIGASFIKKETSHIQLLLTAKHNLISSEVLVNQKVPRLLFAEDIGDIERLQVGYASE